MNAGTPMRPYPRLLGSSWNELGDAIQLAHRAQAPIHGYGRFRIAHGRTRLARLIAHWLRLPPASDSAETRLIIRSTAAGEQWIRSFSDRCLESRQYESRGELVEQFGVLELRFRIEADHGSLVYRQVAAALVFGSFRLRLPPLCAPNVNAREDPAGERRIHVSVRVRFPPVGSVLAYDGTIDIEERRA
jgi:hypothetical protein